MLTMKNKILIGIMFYTTLFLLFICFIIKQNNIDIYVTSIHGNRHLFIEFFNFAKIIESTSIFTLSIACLIISYAFTLSLGLFGLMPWILEKEDQRMIAEAFDDISIMDNPAEELKDAIERQKGRNARAKK